MSNISNEIAKQYMAQWEQLLSESSDLSALFTNKGNNLYGFSILYKDYVQLISKVGIEEMRVFFGYDPTSTGYKFKLLLWGTGGGKNLTEYYCCDDVRAITTALPTGAGVDISVPNMIPKVLAGTWVEAWQNLLDTTSIPSDVFKTDYGNLRGYTFSIQEFLDVLFTANAQKIEEVDILLGDRAFGADSKQGTIGLVLVAKAMTTRGDDGGGYGTFIDVGFPCPPTCPGL